MVALGTLKPSPVQTNIEVAYSGGKCVLVAVVTCLAMMSVTPALAAPRQIEDFCFERSRHVTFWHRGDYEAFMANCIANHTPTPTKKRKYRKY